MCGYVYFLTLRDVSNADRDFGLVKIGTTTGDVLRRISTLQTGNPYDLILFESLETPWHREVEHFMHRLHATDMLKPEWLRCNRAGLPALVEEAKKAVLQIGNRKAREAEITASVSNGRVRRATPEEFQLHRGARDIMRQLVPAKLVLRTVEARLQAATGSSLSIPGIVRVKLIPPGERFNSAVAENQFPSIASECKTTVIQGAFRWRRMPKAVDFLDQYEALALADQKAEASAAKLLRDETEPQEATPRTPELESLHEEYLRMLPMVQRLEGDLADVRTELISQMEDYDALDPVCSFARKPTPRIDRSRFRHIFPEEYRQCHITICAQVRKFVYRNRSYLPA